MPAGQTYEIRICLTGSVPKQEDLSVNWSSQGRQVDGEGGGPLWWWGLGVISVGWERRNGMTRRQSRGGKVMPYRKHLCGTQDGLTHHDRG